MNKKAIAISSLIVIALVLLTVCYKSYGRYKADNYAKFFAISCLNSHADENIHVDKILRQTPTTLVILIKWGDNEKAYVSIKNWMTRAHDKIQIDVVDKNKSFFMVE